MSRTQSLLTITPNPAIDQTLEVANFAPGMVNRVASSQIHAGGKGINVATILADLAIPVTVTGFLGAANASIFEEHFAAHKLTDRFLRVAGATRTGIKIADTVSHETTDINFAGMNVPAETVTLFEQLIADLAQNGAWCALSGSLPQGVDAAFYARLIERLQAHGVKTLLDTSSEALRHGLAARPEIIKPNIAELEEILGRPLQGASEALAAARELLKGKTELVVISMGSEGALFVSHAEALHAQPPRVEVMSTVGAGDAMVAGILWCHLQGFSLRKTATWSTAFGAHAVTRLGAGIDFAKVEQLAQHVTLRTLETNDELRHELAVEGA